MINSRSAVSFANYAKMESDPRRSQLKGNTLSRALSCVQRVVEQCPNEKVKAAFKTKVEEVTIRLQKRINRDALSEDKIKEYAGELRKSTNCLSVEDCCTLLVDLIGMAIHKVPKDSSKTKINWFGATNKTKTVGSFINQLASSATFTALENSEIFYEHGVVATVVKNVTSIYQQNILETQIKCAKAAGMKSAEDFVTLARTLDCNFIRLLYHDKQHHAEECGVFVKLTGINAIDFLRAMYKDSSIYYKNGSFLLEKDTTTAFANAAGYSTEPNDLKKLQAIVTEGLI